MLWQWLTKLIVINYASLSIRALLAPFLQQGDGEANSVPKEDQHEDDNHFEDAEDYRFKQGEKKKSVIQINPKKPKLSPQMLGLSFMIIPANSDTS